MKIKRSTLKILMLLPRYIGYAISVLLPSITLAENLSKMQAANVEQFLAGSAVSGFMIVTVLVSSIPQLLTLAKDAIPNRQAHVGSCRFWCVIVILTYLMRSCIDMVWQVSLMCLIGKTAGLALAWISDRLLMWKGFDVPKSAKE